MRKSSQVPVLLLLLLSVAFVFTSCDDNNNPSNNGGGANRPPLGPTDLTATAISQSEIQLTWTDWSENEDGFEVWESVDNDTTFVVIDHTTANTTTTLVSGRTTEAAYYYRVRAYNIHGFSTFSNTASVTNQWLRITFDRQDSPPRCIAYHPQGYQVISGSGDYQVKVWNTDSGEILRVLSRHTAPVISIDFSADSLFFASGSEDNTVVIWDAVFLVPHQRLTDFSVPVENVEFFPNSQKLATLASSVKVWNVLDGSNEFEIFISPNGFNDFTISHDGAIIATGETGRILFWNATDGTPLDTIEGISGIPNDMVFGSDDDLLMVGTNEGALIYCEKDTDWHVDEIIDAHPRPLYCMALTSDGRFLATGCWDWSIKIWNARSRALVRTLEGHEYSVYGLDFREDGRYLASAAGDGRIKIWGPFN